MLTLAPLVVTRSVRPSPLRSAATMVYGCVPPTEDVAAVAKEAMHWALVVASGTMSAAYAPRASARAARLWAEPGCGWMNGGWVRSWVGAWACGGLVVGAVL
ncbi:MAG: hypothetical protein QM783_03680 [Phycisphaerales bacterium]